MISQGDVLWEPGPDSTERGPLADFTRWLQANRGLHFEDYASLWRWSTDSLEEFWSAIWNFYEVGISDGDGSVLAARTLPMGQWFPGARLNYSDEVLRRVSAEGVAVLTLCENGEPCNITAQQLRDEVAGLAHHLRASGVRRGDHVAGYLPNVIEALVGLLATASLGAVWTACAPDFGTQSVLDRFAQVAPVVLVACDGYRFNQREHSRLSVVETLTQGLPSLRGTVIVEVLGGHQPPEGSVNWKDATVERPPLTFEPMAFDDPLWVLFSSGTTGTPKGIIQSHGGIVVEHLKNLSLGAGLSSADRLYVFSSTSWMVWNWLVGCLLVGAVPVLYDGSPTYPDLLGSWRVAAATGANTFGSGAAYLTACQDAGLDPAADLDLSALRSILSTGSPLPLRTWEWIYEQLPDIRLDCSSGGTDICSSIVAGSPWLTVWAGELSAACLAVNAQAYSEDGKPVVGEVGELVITAPLPSMPVAFVNDPDGSRYREAYFAKYPEVWSHGDWIEFSDRGSAVITGRSDATLNRGGVRMGSAEIYSIVDGLPGVASSLVIGIELPEGRYYMPLFVAMKGDAAFDDVATAIRDAIGTKLSPRHLPDEVIEVEAIPFTLTGKKLEIPLKRLLQGRVSVDALASGAISSPQMLEWFAEFGRTRVAPLSHDAAPGNDAARGNGGSLRT